MQWKDRGPWKNGLRLHGKCLLMIWLCVCNSWAELHENEVADRGKKSRRSPLSSKSLIQTNQTHNRTCIVNCYWPGSCNSQSMDFAYSKREYGQAVGKDTLPKATSWIRLLCYLVCGRPGVEPRSAGTGFVHPIGPLQEIATMSPAVLFSWQPSHQRG